MYTTWKDQYTTTNWNAKPLLTIPAKVIKFLKINVVKETGTLKMRKLSLNIEEDNVQEL